ncbi:MAG TPA: ABC transporter permease [Rubrobacteraceae bacterium]|nr:ABC transporter permease [Rubrobacteraceae bacterium]
MVDQHRDTGFGAQPSPFEVAEVGGEHYGKVRGRTQREIIWRRFRRHRLALVGGAVLLLLYLAALATPVIAPYDFAKIDYTAFNQGPSLKHPMGTDRLGRDELTRVLYGGRISLMLGLAVGVFSTMIGATFGIVAGYYSKVVDTVTMGFVDFMLTLPYIPLLLVMGSIFQFTAVTITIAIVILLWPRMARLVRGQVLVVRDQEYVQAAKAVGVSDVKIMLRHILPNVVGVMVVEATLIVALAILFESAISFLGLGIQPPTPSWGNLLTDARSQMIEQWWLTWFPGLMIVITALCVNFLGDGLRDALDPKAVE